MGINIGGKEFDIHSEMRILNWMQQAIKKDPGVMENSEEGRMRIKEFAKALH